MQAPWVPDQRHVPNLLPNGTVNKEFVDAELLLRCLDKVGDGGFGHRMRVELQGAWSPLVVSLEQIIVPAACRDLPQGGAAVLGVGERLARYDRERVMRAPAEGTAVRVASLAQKGQKLRRAAEGVVEAHRRPETRNLAPEALLDAALAVHYLVAEAIR